MGLRPLVPQDRGQGWGRCDLSLAWLPTPRQGECPETSPSWPWGLLRGSPGKHTHVLASSCPLIPTACGHFFLRSPASGTQSQPERAPWEGQGRLSPNKQTSLGMGRDSRIRSRSCLHGDWLIQRTGLAREVRRTDGWVGE